MHHNIYSNIHSLHWYSTIALLWLITWNSTPFKLIWCETNKPWIFFIPVCHSSFYFIAKHSQILLAFPNLLAVSGLFIKHLQPMLANSNNKVCIQKVNKCPHYTFLHRAGALAKCLTLPSLYCKWLEKIWSCFYTCLSFTTVPNTLSRDSGQSK